MKLEHGLESLYNSNDPAYRDYQEFIATFDTDEFILLAVKNTRPVTNPDILTALQTVSQKLTELESGIRVISISNIRLPQKASLTHQISRLVIQHRGQDTKPKLDVAVLDNLRSQFPILDYLVSKDHHTVGILVQRSEIHRFDPLPYKLQNAMKAICAQSFPASAQIHIVGIPVIREAFERYNLQTALTFGVLAVLIGIVIEIYIFKNLYVPFIVFTISALAISCGLGLMALLGIHINMATSLSFGMVLVITTSMVIHIVSHYNEQYLVLEDKLGAIRQALGIVGRPCFMCALTTAVGFGSIMLCGVPIIRQFGLIMMLSVLLSFLLTMTLIPFFIMVLPPPKSRTFSKMSIDIPAVALRRVEQFVFAHYRLCTIAGLILVVLITTGVSKIRTETNMLDILRKNLPEMKATRFVEHHLASINSISIMVVGDTNTFRSAEGLQHVQSLKNRIEQMPYVDKTESIFPHLEALFARLQKANSWPDDMSAEPRVIKSLISVILVTPLGRHMIGEYISDRFSRIRIKVRLRPGSAKQLNRIVEEIQDVARCLRLAYKICSKALISTSAVMIFAFFTLVLAPLRPTASFGLLASCAILAALIGDLVIMPAVILSSEKIKQMLIKSVLSKDAEVSKFLSEYEDRR